MNELIELIMALGLVAILRRDMAQHRAWMIRGYAIGQGAGTQALTALLWVLIFGTQGEPYKDLRWVPVGSSILSWPNGSSAGSVPSVTHCSAEFNGAHPLALPTTLYLKDKEILP